MPFFQKDVLPFFDYYFVSFRLDYRSLVMSSSVIEGGQAEEGADQGRSPSRLDNHASLVHQIAQVEHIISHLLYKFCDL